jgi:hypothetical protein
VENLPNGFPRLAAFQSSEASFSLYRSFSYLHSRILLDLQDEIRELEQELDDKDWDAHDDNPDRLRSREIDLAAPPEDGNERTSRVILGEIKAKLLEYGASITTYPNLHLLILTLSQMRSSLKPVNSKHSKNPQTATTALCVATITTTAHSWIPKPTISGPKKTPSP